MAELVEIVWKTPRAAIGAVTLDAAVMEDHASDADVTEHPVETGAPVSDHIRLRPLAITIQGIISNTPITEAERRQVEDAVVGGQNRAELAFTQLRQLQERGEVVTVVTGLRVYESMALKSLRAPRDARTGDALRFTAQLVQVRRVESRTVAVIRKTSTPRGSGDQNLGKQVTKPATEPQRYRSLLHKGLGSALGLDKLGTTVPGGS